jgi:glycerol uptake facilitator-like aquaporin
MVGEFIGTFLFLFFAFSGTQVANAAANGANVGDSTLAQVPNAGVLMYIALAFGFSLAVNAWVFFRISGGQSSGAPSTPRPENTSLTTLQVCSILLSPSVWP